MKTQIILSQNVNNEIVYSHTISLDLNDAVTHKFGSVIGALAHRFYKQIVITKMNGNGKGLSLRNPFDFQFIINGKTLVDTFTIDENIKAKIRVGTTAKTQSRFARLLAITLYNEMEHLHSDAICDLLDDENSVTAEMIMHQVREMLDYDISEVI